MKKLLCLFCIFSFTSCTIKLIQRAPEEEVQNAIQYYQQGYDEGYPQGYKTGCQDIQAIYEWEEQFRQQLENQDFEYLE